VLVPDIALYLADRLTPIWHATEAYLATHNCAPPYWAFAWPGAEALARYITDNPALVAGRDVLDFAAGGGLAAIACARAGARSVEAAEIDPLASAAITLNAALNGVTVHSLSGDLVGTPCRWDVIIAGDIFYESKMTAHVLPWLIGCAAGAAVLIADPQRRYAPAGGRVPLARLTVPTSLEIEDSTGRDVEIFALMPV
jgi:predicted nicotinamide N-methyase